MPTLLVQEIDRLSPCQRPVERAVGYQFWLNLFFLHWRVPVDLMQSLLPEELTVDTFEGEAWLGLVPFQMKNVRPRRLPAISFVSNFWETNLRTYVHFRGENPGVWFFTLEANCRLAAFIASRFWHLNYNYSRLQCEQSENRFLYSGQRIERQPLRLSYQVDAHYLGEREATQPAEPGTLEHFLAERYLLYTTNKRGELLSGQVYHQPYPLLSAEIECYEGTLIEEMVGEPVKTNPDHVLFSPGVNVEMFGLKKVLL